jgi:signal peptidase I
MADPADAGPAGTGPRRRRRWRRALAETAITILVAVLLAGLVRAFAFPTFWIPSASMVPTLGVYDRVLVQKAFFTWRDVREGDIVVFSHPPLDQCGGPREGGDLVKRVIALPGQTIYSSANSIYVNGRRLAEPYLPHNDPLGPPIPDASSQHPYRVPPGEFYMLGDNRADSCDSRYWGPIKGPSIIGKVVLTFWHDDHPDLHRF